MCPYLPGRLLRGAKVNITKYCFSFVRTVGPILSSPVIAFNEKLKKVRQL